MTQAEIEAELVDLKQRVLKLEAQLVDVPKLRADVLEIKTLVKQMGGLLMLADLLFRMIFNN